ncbi:MAG: hypothetical protein WC375_00290 [Methanomassiliicoccales archaeon]|jgi:hypothetical protein
MKRYEIPEFDIVVDVDEVGKSGKISSGLHDIDAELNPERDASIDGIESFLLAMACEGIDISSVQIVNCVRTAVEACENHLS